MENHRQWSAAFAAYFAILGLWTSFGPSTLMALNPEAAPVALAAISLSYFIATPLAHRIWQRLGFEGAITGMGAGVLLFLALSAVVPAWLVWCAPVALLLGSGAYTLCETRRIEVLVDMGQGHSFGDSRKWGSFGFLVAAGVGGAVLSLSGVLRIFLLALAVCALVFWLCCIALGRVTSSSRSARQTAQAMAIGMASGPSPMRPNTRARVPLARGAIGGCAALAGMRLAESISVTWFGAYWLHTGHSPLETGLLCALPVAAEFVAMWKGGAVMVRWSLSVVMCVCCLFSVGRWVATPMCADLWCAVPIQMVHALSMGLFYPASVLWQKNTFGADFFFARYATESVVRAMAAVLAFVAAQWVIASYGYAPLYLLSAVLALLAGLWWLRQSFTPQGTA